MTIQPQSTETLPLACVADAIPAAERPAHFVLIRRLFGEIALESRPTPDGYEFAFPADALETVARFVANERKCCPFLSFTIEVPADGGSTGLRITGPEGTPEFLRAEFSI